MFYVKFNKDTGVIIGCINYDDPNSNLIEISKQQYLDFVEGKITFQDYIVKEFEGKYSVEKKPPVVQTAITYNNLYKLRTDNFDILVARNNDNLVIELTSLYLEKDGSLVKLYLTELNNPFNLLDTVTFSMDELIDNTCLNLKIPSSLPSQISIYTKKRISIGFVNE